MAYGDGPKKQPERYEKRPCPSCGDVRQVRKDQPKTKLCRSCAMKARGPLKIKKPSARHDPTKKGAWESYWQAKRRAAGKADRPEYYTDVEFRFTDFDEWWAELGERPEGCTVDRINNLGHYEPGNVRWATQTEQNRNRRPRRWAKRPDV